MKQKRVYQKPRTTVVELQHRTMLLAGSGEPQCGAEREEYVSCEW